MNAARESRRQMEHRRRPKLPRALVGNGSDSPVRGVGSEIEDDAVY